AVLAWCFAVYKKKNDSPSSGSNGVKSGGSSGGGNAQRDTAVAHNGATISNTIYDLKRVFFGMAYALLNAQLLNCYNAHNSVDDEIQLLVQNTKRSVSGSIGTVPHTQDKLPSFTVMLKYDWSNVIGVSVGNEVIFDHYQPMNMLLAHAQEVTSQVVALGHLEIPIFT
ncbi:hypothetical protein BGX26_005627, partial [Mortierella sp. AD094]